MTTLATFSPIGDSIEQQIAALVMDEPPERSGSSSDEQGVSPAAVAESQKQPEEPIYANLKEIEEINSRFVDFVCFL